MTDDDRLDDGIEARLETFGLRHETRRDGVTAQDVRDLIRELRDARAENERLNEHMERQRKHYVLVEAELAAERAKVERVEAFLTDAERGDKGRSLRAKLAAAEQERDDLRTESERLRGLAAEREAQLRYAVSAGETERGHSNDACCSCCYDLNPQRRRADRAEAALAAVRELHRPERCVTVGGTDMMCAECRRAPQRYDESTWPCPTIRALAAAEQDEPKPSES